MKGDLAVRALKMAVALRQLPGGCTHHTDRGSQYCSHDYQKLLRQHGFQVSMSGKGNCYDNSAVETFFKTIKAELAIFQYIEPPLVCRRLLSSYFKLRFCLTSRLVRISPPLRLA